VASAALSYLFGFQPIYSSSTTGRHRATSLALISMTTRIAEIGFTSRTFKTVTHFRITAISVQPKVGTAQSRKVLR
jgi:hypothetical protein